MLKNCGKRAWTSARKSGFHFHFHRDKSKTFQKLIASSRIDFEYVRSVVELKFEWLKWEWEWESHWTIWEVQCVVIKGDPLILKRVKCGFTFQPFLERFLVHVGKLLQSTKQQSQLMIVLWKWKMIFPEDFQKILVNGYTTSFVKPSRGITGFRALNEHKRWPRGINFILSSIITLIHMSNHAFSLLLSFPIRFSSKDGTAKYKTRQV